MHNHKIQAALSVGVSGEGCTFFYQQIKKRQKPTQASPGYCLVQGTIEDKLVRKLKGPTDARGL